VEWGAFVGGEDAFFAIDCQPFEEGQMGLEDGPEIDRFAGEEGLPGGDGVEEEAEGELPEVLLGREAFGHHDKVIPEVEEDLAFVAFWQGPSADVIDDGLRTTVYFVTCQLQAPAEIDLFLVGEEEVFEAF